MSDVTNSANVDGGLAGDDLRVEGGHETNIKVVQSLWSEMLLGQNSLLLLLNDFLDGGLLENEGLLLSLCL